MEDRSGVMSFSPIVHRKLASAAADMVTKNKTGSLQAQMAARNATRAHTGGDKENTGYDGDSTSHMRVPKSADMILMHMKKEVDSARGFLRDVSAGRAGNDGPYFSPCRAKGAGDVNSIKNHPIYMANVSPDEEYEMLLSSASLKKTRQEPAKEAALQRTVNLKLRQATQELLNKRNALAEKLCRLDDSFGEKEKSYKAQVHSFTQQIKKEQASRVRAESQAETYKTAAETQTSHLQAVAKERDALLVSLQQAHEELAGRASMEKDTLIQLGALASSVNEDLVFAVRELQQALQGAQDGLHGLEEREAQVRQELQDLDAKYKEDVGLLRMQMEEMCEAREEEQQRAELQMRKELQDLDEKCKEDVGLLRMQMEEMGEAREEELQRAELQMGELRQLLQTQEAEAQTHVAELQGRLEEQARGLEEREIELKDMAAQLQEIQEHLEAKSGELGEYKALLEDKVQEMSCLQEHTSAEHARLTAEAQEQHGRLNAKMQEQMQQVASHLLSIETLQAKVQDLQAAQQDLAEELRQSSEALEQEQTQHAAACERERLLQEALASLQKTTAQTLAEKCEELEEARLALAGKECALQDVHSGLADLQSQHQQLQESHAQLGGSSDELQQSLAQLQQERAEVRAALESAEAALDQEQTQHAAACERERFLQDTLEATGSELRSLQEQKAAADSALQAAELAHASESTEMQARVQELQARVQDLKEQIAVLEEEGGSANEMALRHAATIALLQEKLQTKTDECKELGGEVVRRKDREGHLQQDVQREMDGNKALVAKVEALEEKTGDLREKLAVAQAQLSLTEEDMKLRQGREDKREAELSELKTQHQDLMHVRKSMIADRDRLAAEVAAEMGRAAQAQQRLHAELDAAHSMRDELQRQAAELREELKEKSEALASANAQVQDKISEVAALAGSLQEQQMLKDRADSESKSALEALAKECAVAAAASKALESDKKELMWKTQAQEDKVADLKTLLAGLQLQLEERRKDLDKCEGEKQEARLEAARLKAERDLQEGKLEETRAKLDAKEEQIKDAMKTVQQVQNMSLERSKEVAKERESQEREREALTRDMLQGKDDLVQAHRELDSLKKSLADLEAKGCSADDALGKSKVEVESLQAEVAELSSKLDKVVKEKSAATERLAVVEAEYRTYKKVCNTPTKLADQLSKLVSLEADRASVQSRLFEAEEDADHNKALVVQLKGEIKELKQKLVRADNTRRKLHNELQELKGNIRVFARVRPSDERCVLGIDEEIGSVTVPYNGNHSEFKFDRAFNPRSTQEEVFCEVSQFVQSALDGYNVSLFAYGQTGSGKTHTMFGSGSNTGIIPRSILQILEAVEEQKENNWEYALEASFLEIYQEQIFDLLTPEAEREGKKYSIVQGENGRHDVTDLEWRTVRTLQDVEEMLDSAQRNKADVLKSLFF